MKLIFIVAMMIFTIPTLFLMIMKRLAGKVFVLRGFIKIVIFGIALAGIYYFLSTKGIV